MLTELSQVVDSQGGALLNILTSTDVSVGKIFSLFVEVKLKKPLIC